MVAILRKLIGRLACRLGRHPWNHYHSVAQGTEYRHCHLCDLWQISTNPWRRFPRWYTIRSNWAVEVLANGYHFNPKDPQ